MIPSTYMKFSCDNNPFIYVATESLAHLQNITASFKGKSIGNIVLHNNYRCRDLRLKQLCLENIVPAVLIILIVHIILTIRWMLIKILSVMIRHHKKFAFFTGSSAVSYHKRACFSIQRTTIVEKLTILCYNMA